MTDTFSTDNVQQVSSDQTNGNADNNGVQNFDAGNQLQQQIDVMQKRMGDKDTHISTVEGENKTLQVKLAEISERIEKMTTVEDALARMKENNESTQDTKLDEATLKSMMKNALPSMMAETTAEEKADANFNTVADTLTKLYGKDKVDETVRQVALDNGLDFNDMINLARKSPNALYKMAGINKGQQVNTTSSVTHSTNTGYNENFETKEQKLAYFSKLRKEDRAEYYKPATQKRFREVCLSN
jgi:regulator of replication initiation timing